MLILDINDKIIYKYIDEIENFINCKIFDNDWILYDLKKWGFLDLKILYYDNEKDCDIYIFTFIKNNYEYILKLTDDNNFKHEYFSSKILSDNDIGPKIYNYFNYTPSIYKLYPKSFNTLQLYNGIIMEKLDYTLDSLQSINDIQAKSIIDLFKKSYEIGYIHNDLHLKNLMFKNNKALYIDSVSLLYPSLKDGYYLESFISYIWKFLGRCLDKKFYNLCNLLVDFLSLLLTIGDTTFFANHNDINVVSFKFYELWNKLIKSDWIIEEFLPYILE